MRKHLVAACVILTGCMPIGPTWRDPGQVTLRGKQGIMTVAPGTPLGIELLAVTDTSYIVETSRRVAEAPFRIVMELELEGSAAVHSARPAEFRLQYIREAARFPFGITAEAMTNLLRAHNQTEIDKLGS